MFKRILSSHFCSFKKLFSVDIPFFQCYAIFIIKRR
nr:MAG TPA: hypothetical protein [Caudoviricetes sp.]